MKGLWAARVLKLDAVVFSLFAALVLGTAAVTGSLGSLAGFVDAHNAMARISQCFWHI